MRDGKKVLIPLENNPDVFTDLIHRLVISSDLGFYDIYSIDEPALLDMVPRPCHAVSMLPQFQTHPLITAVGHVHIASRCMASSA